MYRCFKAFLGVLRQRSLEVEQPIRNRQVMGSTPIVGSKCKWLRISELGFESQRNFFGTIFFFAYSLPRIQLQGGIFVRERISEGQQGPSWVDEVPKPCVRFSVHGSALRDLLCQTACFS
jgi:hypothetical protein